MFDKSTKGMLAADFAANVDIGGSRTPNTIINTAIEFLETGD